MHVRLSAASWMVGMIMFTSLGLANSHLSNLSFLFTVFSALTEISRGCEEQTSLG